MGSFYTSHMLKGPSHQQVLDWLQDRPALVSKTDDGVTLVLDEACESQDVEMLTELGISLSSQFSCAVLALLNHDDDILYFALYESGLKTDEYNSHPSYFEESEDGDSPQGGDAARLCSAFVSGAAAEVEAILRSEEFVFATERHRRLIDALGLPSYLFGIGYNYASKSEFPPGTPPDSYVRSAA